MSRIRIVGGTITKTTVGDHNIYSDGNIVYSSGKAITETSDVGIKYGDPKATPPAPLLKKYFEEGWWSSDQEGNLRIKEALLGDHVYFHIKTKNIPDGEVVQMKLYDDDNTEKNEPKEKGKDNDDFIKTKLTLNSQKVARWAVKGNKVVVSLTLNNLESFIKDEMDKQIELYYRCSYKTENVELPIVPSNYLKVTVDTIPQLIFVNGHWNRIANALGASPGIGGEKYWDYFLGSSKQAFVKDSEKYFNIKYKNGTPYFFDGSSFCGASSSGSARKLKGKQAAKEKFEKELKGMQTKIYYFISHSEGGAFAAGVAEYLTENGVTVGEHIMLSCDEADEFTVNNEVPTYQLIPCYLTKDYSIVKKILNLPRFIFHSQQIKKIRDYYIIVDWVVGDYQLKGAIKSGVIISNNPKVDWMSLHADLIDLNVFKQLEDLKKVRVGQIIGEFKGEFYSGYAQYDVNTRFYRVQDKIILDNIPKN